MLPTGYNMPAAVTNTHGWGHVHIRPAYTKSRERDNWEEGPRVQQWEGVRV